MPGVSPGRLVTSILTVLCVPLVCGLDVISSSKLEKCIKDGTQANTSSPLSCQEKLVVVVTVDSGDSLSTQDIDFTLNCIGSPTGACPCPCNYALDSSCTCRDLSSKLKVTVTKGPLWASYPLQYLQAFNYKPYEAIIRPGAGKCKDGELETSPTCGWYYRAGQKVPDSQGFTCTCDPGQIWDETFGTNKQRTRANLDCDFFSDPLDILVGKYPCSAHCLMMDPHWYGGYSLGQASMQFTITATLSTDDSSGSESISISPAVPWALSKNRTLSAKLMGDLAGYTELPVLSERVLMIPHPKSGQTVAQVFANRSEWMLLDKTKVSFDGTECDKVGTTFTAFRFQNMGCKRAPQVCLSNQLRDILESDKARVAQGKVPLYLVSQYSYGLDSELKSFAGGPLSFALPVTGIRSSVVQLETVADSIRLVVNVSPGKILAARMCTFAETQCGGFEASASRGYLHAWLANLGSLDSTYTITVSNCSVSVSAVPAQRVAIPAKGNGTIAPFQIFVEDDAAVARRFCWLSMIDSKGEVTDTVEVAFFTNATKYEDWPTGGLDNNGTGPGTLDTSDCDTACSNKWDLICQVRHGCWGKVGSIFGLVLGTVGGAALLGLIAMKLGWLGGVMQMCGGAGGSWMSCFGDSGGSSDNTGKDGRGGQRSNKNRYEIEDMDSASGARTRKPERYSRSSNNDHKYRTSELKAGKHKQQRNSRSHSSLYETYGSQYENGLYEEPIQIEDEEFVQPQVQQQMHRGRSSSSRPGSRDRSSSRYSRHDNNNNTNRHTPGADGGYGLMGSGAYNGQHEEELDWMQGRHSPGYDKTHTSYNTRQNTLFDEGIDGDDDSDMANETGVYGYTAHTIGNSINKGKVQSNAGHKKQSSSSSGGRGSRATPWDESAAGGGYRPGRFIDDKVEKGQSYIESNWSEAGSHKHRQDLHPDRGTNHDDSQLDMDYGTEETTSPVSGSTRLSHLVDTAHSAAKYLQHEHVDEDYYEGSQGAGEVHQHQVRQSGGYSAPGRAATMPGGMGAAAAAASSSVRSYSSSSGSRRVHQAGVESLTTSRHSQSPKAAKSPAVLQRGLEFHVEDSGSLQPDNQDQWQQQQQTRDGQPLPYSSSKQGTRRSSSQPPDRTQRQHQHLSNTTARLDDDQQYRSSASRLRKQADSHSLRASSESVNLKQQALVPQAAEQQQQQTQRQPVSRTQASRSSGILSSQHHPVDDFFDSYDEDDSELEPDDHIMSSISAAAAVAKHSLHRQQGLTTNNQHAAQRQSQTRNSVLMQQQQRSPSRSPSVAVYQPPQFQTQSVRGTSAPGGASARKPSVQNAAVLQQQQQQQQYVGSRDINLLGPISTPSRPHLAPFHGSSSSTSGAAAADSTRHRQQQQQRPVQDAATPLHQPGSQQQQQQQRRPSVMSLSSSPSGFVRSAAAAMSGSGAGQTPTGGAGGGSSSSGGGRPQTSVGGSR